jgi:CYTH domain-containing protein
MPLEIERKFLLKSDTWRDISTKSMDIRQGYLVRQTDCAIRIRVTNDQAFITIKSKTVGAKRHEFEYPIPQSDANELLEHICRQPLIEKRRYMVQHAGLCWEIDEFFGANKGLILAEVELDELEKEIDIPAWVGQEVTDDPKYFNANLITHPYSAWQAAEK